MTFRCIIAVAVLNNVKKTFPISFIQSNLKVQFPAPSVPRYPSPNPPPPFFLKPYCMDPLRSFVHNYVWLLSFQTLNSYRVLISRDKYNLETKPAK